MKKELRDKTASVFPLILSLVIFANPVVRLVDIFPDFIACFIIAKYLEYASPRSPFFDEARANFLKLGVVNLLKIPANAVIVMARSGNVADYDIIVLFTFTFAVIEAAITIMAINNLFTALFYLGERSEHSALISPLKPSRRSEKVARPENIKTLLIAFTVVKAVCVALPEACLLTRSVDTGSNINVFRPQALYPYAIVLGLLIVVVLGAIAIKYTSLYLCAIMSNGLMKKTLDNMIDSQKLDELTKRISLKRTKVALTALSIASLFTLEVRFDNWNDVNLFPGFIFAIVMMIAIFKLSGIVDRTRPTFICCLIFALASSVRWFVEISFLDNYGYDALVKSNAAKEAYTSVIWTSIFDFIAFAAFVCFISLMLVRLLKSTKTHQTQNSHKTPRVSTTKVYIYAVFAVLSGIAKLVWVILKRNSSYTFVTTDDGVEGIGGIDSIDGISAITTSSAPWFNIVVIAICALFIGYTFYLASEIKEEMEFRYS